MSDRNGRNSMLEKRRAPKGPPTRHPAPVARTGTLSSDPDLLLRNGRYRSIGPVRIDAVVSIRQHRTTGESSNTGPVARNRRLVKTGWDVGANGTNTIARISKNRRVFNKHAGGCSSYNNDTIHSVCVNLTAIDNRIDAGIGGAPRRVDRETEPIQLRTNMRQQDLCTTADRRDLNSAS